MLFLGGKDSELPSAHFEVKFLLGDADISIDVYIYIYICPEPGAHEPSGGAL